MESVHSDADAPWSVEGLPLAEALRRLVRLDGAGRDFLFVESRDANVIRRRQAELFREIMAGGDYRIEGRKGSRTAPSIEIPISALSGADFTYANRNELCIQPGQERWYDVRVFLVIVAAAIDPPAAPAELPGRYTSLKAWLGAEGWNIEKPPTEKPLNYFKRVAEAAPAYLRATAKNVKNRYYEQMRHKTKKSP
jgi:hypothetical protein